MEAWLLATKSIYDLRAVVVLLDESKGMVQITVVINNHVWQRQNCTSEVLLGPLKAIPQFVIGNVVSALSNSHRYTLDRCLTLGVASAMRQSLG